MPLSTQTQQLFDKVFGRSAESNEERSFLRDVEARKGAGTPATFGAIQHAQQSGRFGGGQQGGQAGPPPEEAESFIGNLENAKKLLDKKAKELDKQSKILFTEKLKNQLKSEVMAMPEVKALQKTKGELSKGFQETSFGAKDSQYLRPSFVDQTRANDQGAYAQSISDLTEALRSTDSGIGSILDRSQADRATAIEGHRNEFDMARNMFSDALSYENEQREQELHPFRIQQEILQSNKTLAEIDKLNREGKTNVVPGDESSLSELTKVIMRNPAAYNTITPTEKGEVLKELGAYGVPTEVLNDLTLGTLSGAQRDSIAGFDTLETMATRLQTLLENETFGTGMIESRKNAGLAKFGLAPEGWNDYAGLTAVTSAEQLREMSGVAVTPSEFERLRPYLPTKNDAEATAKDKLANFIKVLQEIRTNKINRGLQTSIQLKRGEDVVSSDQLLQQAINDGLIEN